jgi:hypothetical protein
MKTAKQASALKECPEKLFWAYCMMCQRRIALSMSDAHTQALEHSTFYCDEHRELMDAAKRNIAKRWNGQKK